MSDKTEEPTPKKLAKAREKGQIAVSAAASQALAFLVAVFAVPSAITATGAAAAELLGAAVSRGIGVFSPAGLVASTVLLVTPALAAVAGAAALATVIQTGALFAPGRVAPDWTRLDPIGGLRGLFGASRLWNVARALAAAVAVGYLAWSAGRHHVGELALTVGRSQAAAGLAAVLARRIARGAAAVGLCLAVVDLVVVHRAHRAKLRMTKDEVKREHRDSEGDPHVKAARQRAYRDMLSAATLNAVRDATVVIVNPEHLATALRYLESEDDAPKVVATGDGDLARQIQEAARAYGIPIVRDVPVARALRELEVGDVIPEALYEAVAEILREVWETEEAEKEGAFPPGTEGPGGS